MAIDYGVRLRGRRYLGIFGPCQVSDLIHGAMNRYGLAIMEVVRMPC